VADGAASEQIIADRYTVERRIAKGGMATVYLASQVKVNRPVALKVLSPPNDEEVAADFLSRFHLEAETLAALDHRNIVTLYDFGELPGGRFYLAMEYVDGPRFSDLVKTGPLPADEAIRLLLQVCSALRYAHKQGVVHRDLKPSNLLIKRTDDGVDQVKVVDFGLVKLTSEDHAITRAGMILGSPHCMSPEQIHGRDLDHRADIYSVGVLLYRTVVGAYPFHGPTSAATMVQHLNEPVPPMGRMNPDVELPDGYEAVVRRCLAKVPDDRYPDMEALITDLSLILAGTGEGVVDEEPSASTMRPGLANYQPAPRRWWPVAALALAAMMLVGSGVALAGAGVLIGVWASQPSRGPAVAPSPAPSEAPVPVAPDDAPAPAPPPEPAADTDADAPKDPSPRPRPAPRPDAPPLAPR